MSISFRTRAKLAEMVLQGENVPLRLKAQMVREILQIGDGDAR